MERPRDDDTVAVTEVLRWQRDYAEDAGSWTAAQILAAVEDDLTAGGPLAAVLPATTRFGDLISLRVMAVVHRLALERRAPAVAMRLPTLGGTAPVSPDEQSGFRRDVVDLLASHPDELRAGIAQTPQTNETGRAVLLRCALSRMPGLPIRLHEIGASAGLNLRADHLPGDPGLEAGPLPPIVERVGCDLDPVDITTAEGRSLLGSYIWVDDVERFRRLGRAMDVAVRVPADVRREDATEFVESMSLEPGSRTVLWHSAMWIYLPEPTRDRVSRAIEALGAGADASAPFAHVSWEWDPDGDGSSRFQLCVRRWGGPDDGSLRVLARGMSHGREITLEQGA